MKLKLKPQFIYSGIVRWLEHYGLKVVGVSTLLSPPKELELNEESKEALLLSGALIMDFIWKQRNRVAFDGGIVMMEDLRRGARKIFKEHWGVRAIQIISCSAKRSSNWSRPPIGIIKMNVDAAIRSSFSVIAAVAKD